MDYGTILEYIAKWLSSGPLGIITGLLGFGGIAYALFALSKKIKEAKFQSAITNAAQEAGEDSGKASDGMRENTRQIEEAIALEKLRQASPGSGNAILAAPKTVKKNIPFDLVARVPDGSVVYADKQWIVGYIYGGKLSNVSLNTAGKRTLDVKLKDVWYSVTVQVEE